MTEPTTPKAPAPEPAKPDSVKPAAAGAAPTKLAAPAKPKLTPPTRPTAPTRPGALTKPATPAKPVETPKPLETSKPVEPSRAAELAAPATAAEPTPAELAKAAAALVRSAEPPKPAERPRPPDRPKLYETLKGAEPSGLTGLPKSAEVPKSAELPKPAEPPKVTQVRIEPAKAKGEEAQAAKGGIVQARGEAGQQAAWTQRILQFLRGTTVRATQRPDVAPQAESAAEQAKSHTLDPVQAKEERPRQGVWTQRLVWFLRGMSVIAMLKGLFHWSVVIGIGDNAGDNFALHSLPYQAATVFFAVFDLVAAVGLWLAAAWGAVVWLTSAVSMAAVEVFFPQVYGGRILVVVAELIALGCYLWLAWRSANEHLH